MTPKLRHVIAIAAVLVPLWPSSASAGTIRMLSAVYGTVGTNAICDATGRVANMCNGRPQCTVDIRNINLCGDPNFLVVKQTAIEYRCGRRIYRLSGNEYYSYNLACE